MAAAPRRPDATPAKDAPRAAQDVAPEQKQRLLTKFAEQLGVEPSKMLDTLKGTVFRVKDKESGYRVATNEECTALLVVAHNYGLNPFLKEIYAFPAKGGGIVPVVALDGWVTLVQRQPTYRGVKWALRRFFNEADELMEMEMDCTITTTVGETTITEYWSECKRDTDPWRDMPRRMLRNRAYVQCARMTFGFGGIYDPDEATEIGVPIAAGVDLLPATKADTKPPAARADAPKQLVDENHLELINEKLAKTGVPENLVLAKFECGTLEEIPAARADDVLRFIGDNAP